MIKDQKSFPHLDWSYQSNIYEVNLRQYTTEGTINAFSKHLPRLRTMGVEVLWFMPITPISNADQLGPLGSYYAAKDYTSINPEFGTMDDFKKLVADAHGLGFKIIIDFVGNHTGNDHHWTVEHPDYYVHQPDGSLLHPHGWTDVAQLNFENKEVWKALSDAMCFWIRECDIDGFRCDMAHLVPLDLWIEARTAITKIKSEIFMLAECEVAEYHKAFDATYTWKWMHATEDFCKEKISLDQLLKVLFSYNVEFPSDAFRVYFTSNHDENSWNGTEYEKYGDAAKMLAVFSCTWNGLPMIYSGQELPNMKRLKFFDKDPIEWTGTYQLQDFYHTLLSLRRRNAALRAGDNTVSTIIISKDDDSKVLAYVRKNGSAEVLTVLNFSVEAVSFEAAKIEGEYKNVFSGATTDFSADNKLQLTSWGYAVFEKL